MLVVVTTLEDQSVTKDFETMTYWARQYSKILFETFEVDFLQNWISALLSLHLKWTNTLYV